MRLILIYALASCSACLCGTAPSALCEEENAWRATIRGIPTTCFSTQRVTALDGRLINGLQNATPDGAWRPSTEIVDRLLADLPKRLERNLDSRGKQVAARLSAQARVGPASTASGQYAAQILGLIIKGRRLVHANFFRCDSDCFGHGDELFIMDDGGIDYFQVWFDPATGEFPLVMINGEA